MRLRALAWLLVPALLLAGCAAPGGPGTPAELVLATTTSTRDTGLLDALLPTFEAEHRAVVKVVAVGSGLALELGRTGDADVVLAHAPGAERALLAAGAFVARREVMYNQFLLVGPGGDPWSLRAEPGVAAAFQALAANGGPFVSRGDGSGTHLKEQELWALAGLDYGRDVAVPGNAWYRSVGQGMGATLRIAAEERAYTLTDDGTWHAVQPAGLAVVRQEEPPLHNQYSVLRPNATRTGGARAELAGAFADWLAGDAAQQRIAAFEVAGHRLFTPNAGTVERG